MSKSTPRLEPWELTPGAHSTLLEILGLKRKIADAATIIQAVERSGGLAHVFRDGKVPRSMEEFPARYREAVTVVTRADAALDGVEDAIRSYCERPKEVRPAHIRDRLSELGDRLDDVIRALTSSELFYLLSRLKRRGLISDPAGGGRRDVIQDLRTIQTEARELRDVVAGKVTSARTPDGGFRILVWGLCRLFDRYAVAQSSRDSAAYRLDFVTTALKAANLPSARKRVKPLMAPLMQEAPSPSK